MLKWIALGTCSFIFLVALIFGIMLAVNPPHKPPPKTGGKKIGKVQKKGKNVAYSPKTDSLHAVVQKYQQLIGESKQQIDSLRIVIKTQSAQLEEKDKKLEQLTKELAAKANKDKRAKDMAKTLAAMKVKQMAPILNKLDDATIISIFQQTSKTARTNILTALSDERAARITEKLIN